MASRWRRWNQNQDFVVDILSDESRLNSLFMKTRPVRGRGKIKIDFNKLSIPDLKQENDFTMQQKKMPIPSSSGDRTKKHCKVVGRGRGRKANIDDIIGLHNANNRAVCKSSYYLRFLPQPEKTMVYHASQSGESSTCTPKEKNMSIQNKR